MREKETYKFNCLTIREKKLSEFNRGFLNLPTHRYRMNREKHLNLSNDHLNRKRALRHLEFQ